MRRRVLAGPWVALLLAILGFLVVYPRAHPAIGRADRHQSGGRGFRLSHLSIANFLVVLANPNVAEGLINTLIACGGGTLIAVLIGLAFSWIVVRTNTPFKRHRGRPHPAAVRAVAWAILGSPKTGLNNIMFKWISLESQVDFYSMWPGVRVWHLLRALRLHVHLLGAAQHGSEPGRGREISGASAFAMAVRLWRRLVNTILSMMLLRLGAGEHLSACQDRLLQLRDRRGR